MCRVGFKTTSLTPPNPAVPINATWLTPPNRVLIEFSRNLTPPFGAANGWDVRYNDRIRFGLIQLGAGPASMTVTVPIGAPQIGPDVVHYDAGLGNVLDDLGRPVPSFTDFPIT